MKKALVVISFGTTYPAARCAIAQIENTIKQQFPDYDFYRAFTSRMVIEKIARVEGERILTPQEQMQNLVTAGYEEVLCQSLHVIPGFEYEKMCAQIAPYRTQFAQFSVGTPLLYSMQDYKNCAQVLRKHHPVLAQDEAFVYMGHGTEHPSNACYALMENTFRICGAERVYIATVDGFPDIDYVLHRLKKQAITRVHLAPFMIVAGDHAQNDLAGAQEDSWKSILHRHGYEVHMQLQGLGEYEEIAHLFVGHIALLQENSAC